MNILEVQKEIARISPAAGRQSEQLVAEIGRLNILTANLNQSIIAHQAEMERLNIEVNDLRAFAGMVRQEFIAAGMKHDPSVQLLEQIQEWLEGEPGRKFNQMAEILTQVAVVLTGMPPSVATAGRLRAPLIEEFAEGFLMEMAAYRSAKQEAEEAQATLTREVQNMRGDVLIRLQEFTEYPQSEVAIPNSFREFQLSLESVVRLMRARQSKFRDEAKANHNRRMKSTVENCAMDLNVALGGSAKTPRPESIMAWWEQLTEQAYKLRDKQGATAEALTNALQHNKELEQALTELKPHTYDIQGVQFEAERLAETLDRTHSALLEMQDGYLKERNKRLEARRDLAKARADIEFLKTASSMAVQRLQAVDMALRGEGSDIETVSPFRSTTLDLAERMWTRVGDYRRAAEREVSWRQDVEKQRDELAKQLRELSKEGEHLTAMGEALLSESTAPETEHNSGCPDCGAPQPSMHPVTQADGGEITFICKNPFHGRFQFPQHIDQNGTGHYAVNQVSALAECGQPFPCEHAPDGGNHPTKAAW